MYEQSISGWILVISITPIYISVNRDNMVNAITMIHLVLLVDFGIVKSLSYVFTSLDFRLGSNK